MNSIELLLIELVQMAESPLYSAYRWLGRQLGRELSMREFVRIVDDLSGTGALQIWSIDSQLGTRTILDTVPSDLEVRYSEVGHSDPTYDPFALSLTVGPAVPSADVPDWVVEFDFRRETFSVNAAVGTERTALSKLADVFPDIELIEDRRAVLNSGRLELSGRVRPRSA